MSIAPIEEGHFTYFRRSLAVWKTTVCGRVGLAGTEITKGICGALPPLASSFKGEETA